MVDLDELDLVPDAEKTETEKKAERKQKAIEAEYESAFDGEDKAIHALNIKSNIKITYEVVDIDDLVVPQIKKVGREQTVIGLSGIVGEWGVATPIHVLKLTSGNDFLILDGLRRVFAAKRNGKTEIPAMVWVFDDVEEGKQKANILSLMLNRSEKFKSKELWEQMQILELVHEATPGLVEYLLQMYPGEAMKLKDVMTCEYSEIVEKLESGELTIEAAYKKLCAERKKENRLSKEDGMMLEGGSSVASEEEMEAQKLGVDEVKDLLEMSNKDVSDESLEDLNRSSEVSPVKHQHVGDREPVEKAIKQATLARDEFKCRCCQTGGKNWASVLIYHHLIPVYLNGPDTVENGLTLCANCHLTLHNYIDGSIPIDISDVSDKEKATFKNIFKYGNIAIEAAKKVGMKNDEVKELNKASKRHLFPNEVLHGNLEAMKTAQA